MNQPGEAPIERRSDAEVERELAVNRQGETSQGRAPGGAEGGDESNSARWLVDHPRDTDPLGDTDQHSDQDKLPEHRARENDERRG